MLARRAPKFIARHDLIQSNFTASLLSKHIYTEGLYSTGSCLSKGIPEYMELPRKLRKSERKPFIAPINEIKRQARLEKKMKQEVCEFKLQAPDNGLLVKSLVPVAHDVYMARIELLQCISMIIGRVLVHSCRVCGEVHVGATPHKIRSCDVSGSLNSKEHTWGMGSIDDVLPCVESFHLYDRLGRAVTHEERLRVDRVPAIVELCMQSGVDVLEFPTRRYKFPAYSVAGKTIDFERRFPRDVSHGDGIQTSGFWMKGGNWEKKENLEINGSSYSTSNDTQVIAERGLKAWEKMRNGAMKLMRKYRVWVCGYCPEVQVGPRGHRVRTCGARKHQARDGQHAWQEAEVNDIVPPVHVWHVQDPGLGGVPFHELRGYYGKLPAVVEMCAQAGASVGKEYEGLMRLDVAVPDLDEEKLVV
ncbi:hypothetical protein AMTRI_Chr07g81000 [Amborella trichopoda]|uniref:APO protein 3, mitochondrial isoform X2 n=1 Tax=Amborella trichopoda TaxID=13333 RepID=UPI0005D30E16|nr:APO protein 3, mitochondrial isoform X2 [Amborella trichopoda]|eukprot:XP_011625057.1 APO protein 3, mitochondrial isoform X2 [Amborella trichopoda]